MQFLVNTISKRFGLLNLPERNWLQRQHSDVNLSVLVFFANFKMPINLNFKL